MMTPASRPDPAQRLRDIQAARSRMAPLLLADLLARLPAEAASACGLDRALLLLVRDDDLVPAAVFDDERAAHAADYVRLVCPRLADCPLEAEVARRGEPVLVHGAGGGTSARPPLVTLAGANGFALAPLVHPDRTIGLLYGDRREAPLDELDREFLWTFATAAAPLLHLATLAAIARPGDQPETDPPAEAALTRREVAILRLMADGAGDAAIAERLAVSETTVRTHVREIQRKLGAADRADAVARYGRHLHSPALGA
jgi:DNA-binding CsgD family transcriptional regulator